MGTFYVSENIAKQIMETYKPQSAQEIQDVVKQIIAPIFEAALQGEMDNHLGYANHERSEQDSSNSRNGFSTKKLKTSMGEVPIRIPRDRESSFNPQIVKKHQRDVSGLEDGARAIFPQVVVQCCIVHLIRNSVCYIPREEWSRFTRDLKLIYGAVNVKQARDRFEQFKKDWANYPGAVSVWESNFTHVEQLFNYGSAVRKVMYTTNAIESVNSSFRKVTKKGSFPNEDAVFKILYLRVLELYKKWNKHRLQNWAMIRNQLLVDERMAKLMKHYDVIY